MNMIVGYIPLLCFHSLMASFHTVFFYFLHSWIRFWLRFAGQHWVDVGPDFEGGRQPVAHKLNMGYTVPQIGMNLCQFSRGNMINHDKPDFGLSDYRTPDDLWTKGLSAAFRFRRKPKSWRRSLVGGLTFFVLNRYLGTILNWPAHHFLESGRMILYWRSPISPRSWGNGLIFQPKKIRLNHVETMAPCSDVVYSYSRTSGNSGMWWVIWLKIGVSNHEFSWFRRVSCIATLKKEQKL